MAKIITPHLTYDSSNSTYSGAFTGGTYALNTSAENLHFDLNSYGAPTTGIYIPQPIVHYKNYIQRARGSNPLIVYYDITSEYSPRIQLSHISGGAYNITDNPRDEWKNLNPYYFLFYYRSHSSPGRLKRGYHRQASQWVHPTNINDGGWYGIIRNRSGGCYNPNANVQGNYFRSTEWPVNTAPFARTQITVDNDVYGQSGGFHPNQFFRIAADVGSGTHWYYGYPWGVGPAPTNG